jgi:hypothetical protein
MYVDPLGLVFEYWHSRLSGKCVYQADSSHSILSDVSRRTSTYSTNLQLQCRRTNTNPFTSMIHTKHLYWTITGVQHLFITDSSSSRVFQPQSSCHPLCIGLLQVRHDKLSNCLLTRLY